MKFHTKLWKRSKKSFATTIPHIALLSMDESKDYNVEWEFDQKIQKWTFSLKENKKKPNTSNPDIPYQESKRDKK